MTYNRPYICPFELLISAVPQGSEVLDIGCGDGLFLNILCQLQKISTGLGFDTNSVSIATAQNAKTHIKNSQGLEFIEWPTDQQWPKGEFEVVSMIDVLHHISLPNKKHAIEEAARCVKPGGLFLFKDIGVQPRWRAFFNSLHDFILTGEVVTYTAITKVVRWAEANGMQEIERTTINRFWYGHEMVLFSKKSQP